MRQLNVLTSELNMDQIECFDGVKLLQRSGDKLKRRTGFNCSVFSSISKQKLLEKQVEQTVNILQLQHFVMRIF